MSTFNFLPVTFALALAGLAAGSVSASASECLVNLAPTSAGHYNSIGYYQIGRDSYMVGQEPGFAASELRNWFVFAVPPLPVALAAAELRVPASGVETVDGAERYELHAVATPISTLVNYAGNTTNTFTDLGDGVLLGSRLITTSDSAQPYSGAGTLLTIPLTPAALAALTAAQGGLFALGGALATLDNDGGTVETAFRGGYLPQRGVSLLLFLTNSGQPQVTMFSSRTPVLANSRVSLAAAACGASPISLQWLQDSVVVADATNATLEIPFSLPSHSGSYQLRASNALGVVLSSAVEVEVEPLTIFQHPQSLTLYEPGPATLYVGVFSELPVTYQWRKNGVNVPGATSSQLTLAPATPADSGNYDVTVQNAAGSRTSAVAVVTVFLQPPAITYQPMSQEIAVGLPIYLASSVVGSSPLSFQWFKNGQVIAGATSLTFQLSAIQFSDAGEYQLVASNAAGRATTAVARVTVVGLRLVSGPFASSTLLSNFATLSVGVESSVRVFFQWFYNGARLEGQTNQSLPFPALDFSDNGDYFVIANNLYGAVTSQVATLTVTTQAPIASVYISGGASRFRIGDAVTLRANVWAGPPATLQWLHDGVPLAGQTTNVLRLSYATVDDSGSYAISAENIYGAVTSAPVVLQVVAEAPFFALVPRPTNHVEGSTVTLRSLALGGPPPAYQWRRGGLDMEGATNATLILPAIRAEQGGTYEVVARNESGEATHSSALAVRPVTGLDEWDWRQPRPQGNRLHGVTYGNGRYVAVGKSGNLITSSDGLNWSNLIVEADADLDSVAFGNGRFVVAGVTYTADLQIAASFYPYSFNQTGLVLSSADGVNWTVQQPPEGDGLGQIAFGNGRFVAASRFGRASAYTSEDGVRWTAQLIDDRTVFGVAWGNGRFVATTGDRLYSSTDGAQWEMVYSNPYNYFSAVAYGENGFLAVSFGGNVFASTTGETWSERGSVNCQGIWTLAAGAGRWVGVCDALVGSLVVSSDAITWNIVDTGTAQQIESVLFAEDRFLAVGEAGTLTTSPDGIRWSPSQAANRIDYYGITHGGPVIAAAGDAGTVLTSTNGRSWTLRATPTTRNLHAIHYANGLFVAGGRRGALLSSPDGLVWTARASGVANYLERMTWANNLWVVVGEHGDFTTSSDGTNWIPGTTGPPFTDHEGIAFGNGRWVAVGGYFNDPTLENDAVTTIYTSTDAITWSLQPLAVGKRLRDVAFAQGRFVAVGNDGLVLTSTNTLQWASYFLGWENLRRVHYANGRFVVVGNNGALFSSLEPARADSWVPHRSRSSLNLHDIHAAADGTFYSVGNNGMLLQSGGTLPGFTAIAQVAEGYQLEFDPGLAGRTLRLESSVDLRTWTTLSIGVVSPVTIPPNGADRFFRLAVP